MIDDFKISGEETISMRIPSVELKAKTRLNNYICWNWHKKEIIKLKSDDGMTKVFMFESEPNLLFK